MVGVGKKDAPEEGEKKGLLQAGLLALEPARAAAARAGGKRRRAEDE